MEDLFTKMKTLIDIYARSLGIINILLLEHKHKKGSQTPILTSIQKYMRT